MTNSKDVIYNATDYEVISITDTSVKSLNSTKVSASEQAFVQATSGGMRVLFHGADPSSSVGHIYDEKGGFFLKGKANMTNLRIASTSAPSTITVTYFKH